MYDDDNNKKQKLFNSTILPDIMGMNVVRISKIFELKPYRR